MHDQVDKAVTQAAPPMHNAHSPEIFSGLDTLYEEIIAYKPNKSAGNERRKYLFALAAVFLLFCFVSVANYVFKENPVDEVAAFQQPAGFYLETIDKESNEVIGAISQDPAAISQSDFSSEGIVLKLVGEQEEVKSVQFKLTGPMTFSRTESVKPFTVFGNLGDSYFAQDLPLGSYTISIATFPKARAGGKQLDTAEFRFVVEE